MTENPHVHSAFQQFSNQFATILQSVCSPPTRRSAESMSSLCSAKNSFKAGLLLEMRKVERRSLVNNTTLPVEYYSLPLTFGLLIANNTYYELLRFPSPPPRSNERNLPKTRKILQRKGCHFYCNSILLIY